jgi:Cdc6-like AAA superfamily ATPase
LAEQVSMAQTEVAETGVSKGILLIGDSGVGKTHSFDHLMQHFSDTVTDMQVHTPAIRVSLKTKADAASISKSALLQLGRPLLPNRLTKLDDLETLLHDAIRARHTRVVLLEEFHNGLLAGAAALRTQNRHFLKNLWNMHDTHNPGGWVSEKERRKPWGLVIVVSATVELLKTLANDQELKSRFNTVIESPSLALFPPAVFDDLRRVLKTMLNRYGLHPLS